MTEREELAVQEPKALTPMDLLSAALSKDAAIDVIERLAALQERAAAREAEASFNDALNRVQAEVSRVAPNLTNKQTNSRYASYDVLDRAVRPIYIKEGFSLSFDTESVGDDKVRVLCYVSHRNGHTRTYRVDMPADGKGAKGGDVMTKTHATGAAMSYGMRYLLKYIFNIAIGEEDSDGNLSNGWLAERIEWIENCHTLPELEKIFRAAFSEAKDNKAQKAMLVLVEAKDKRKKELA